MQTVTVEFKKTDQLNNQTNMFVRKRNGALEPVNVNKIVRAVGRCAIGLKNVDAMRIATKTIGGLHDGSSTKELDSLSIYTASQLISEEPEYSQLAARLLNVYIKKEVENQNIYSFSQSVKTGHRVGLISDTAAKFIQENARKLNDAIKDEHSELFEYYGLRIVYDRYLLRHPKLRATFETPQYFFMRVACGLSQTPKEAIDLYNLISAFEYMPSTPTLFNSATTHPQMSSCYLLDAPSDNLDAIYDKYKDVARLSKWAGGIGLAFHRVRAEGSLIVGTNGKSNGIVPFLKTLDSSVSAVNQGGKRKGACCVYLETWHADIEEFLQLRDNTGDINRRTHNINLANWIPDLFMKRVEEDKLWSLFDPKQTPTLTDLFGSEFEKAYINAEEKGLYKKQVKARDLYALMMKTLAETGNGWITFKDVCNEKSNQTSKSGSIVHSSNLCTEIVEVTSESETAVCNLGSINLAKYIKDKKFDFDKLEKNVKVAIKFLDRVIDINFYPTKEAQNSNSKWRPVGLGIMGLADLFFKLDLAFDSKEARDLSAKIQEEIYFHALSASADLAHQFAKHENFDETRAKDGVFQFDLWKTKPTNQKRWNELKKRVKKTGLRNSLLIAIAPTATIASIVGSFESIEPQLSNLFKRETLSGDFIQINKYLVEKLKTAKLWNNYIKDQIKLADGSIQAIKEIPNELKIIYRTIWEIPQKSLIDMAAARGPYIDQSQSLNLFVATPSIGTLSSMYMYAWKNGIKTTYYLRSRPASAISKTTISKTYTPEEAVACSLENPEDCEACQ